MRVVCVFGWVKVIVGLYDKWRCIYVMVDGGWEF